MLVLFACSCFSPTEERADGGLQCAEATFLCADRCGTYSPTCTTAAQLVCGVRAWCGAGWGSASRPRVGGGGAPQEVGVPVGGGGASPVVGGGVGAPWFGGCGGVAGPGPIPDRVDAGEGGGDGSPGAGAAGPGGGSPGWGGGSAGGSGSGQWGADGSWCEKPFPTFHVDCFIPCAGGLTAGICRGGSWVCPDLCSVDAGQWLDAGNAGP